MLTPKTADLMVLAVTGVQVMVAAIESGMTDLVATGCTTGIQMKLAEAEVIDLADSVLAATDQMNPCREA